MPEITDLPTAITANANDEEYDAYLLIANHLEKDLAANNLTAHFSELENLKKLNANFENEVSLAIINKKRVIYSPTGPLNRDQDDVRVVGDAAGAAMTKAIKAGSKKPLIINCVKTAFKFSDKVAFLGALHTAHIPLEVREAKKSDALLKVDKVGYWYDDSKFTAAFDKADGFRSIINGIEIGRIITRDIGGSDPERMAAEPAAKYVQEQLKNSVIKLEVIEGQKNFEKDYPCFAAVNRAADVVPRHRGRIVKLVYDPSNEAPVDQTIFLVGKGITYDTGGADVKAGGHMAGMHRDKCGAAFVAGFFKTLALLKPKGLKVVGFLCLCRNSIGEDAYVADEIITARSGRRLRIGNTDAEGRMAMCDLLCLSKEMALNEINPHLFTIATLTGHAIRAYGEGYSAIMSNGPARALDTNSKFAAAGDTMGDPFEISTIRREDFDMIAGKSEYEDLLQSNNAPSTMTSRGHQFPGAFLTCASGLDEHGNDSDRKLPYTHLDIAGSSGPFPGVPTGSPLPAFAYLFCGPRA